MENLKIKYILYLQLTRKHSELLENLEEMFPRYYMDSSVISMFKSSTRCERIVIAKKSYPEFISKQKQWWKQLKMLWTLVFKNGKEARPP